MSEHFTLRLPSITKKQLQSRAQAVQMAPRTLAQRYIEEGLRRDNHPLIRFTGGRADRRAALVGSGLDVWEVIETVRYNDNDLAETATYLSIPVGLVEAAVIYYGEYREEIDAEIASNEAAWERGYAAWQAGQRALSS